MHRVIQNLKKKLIKTICNEQNHVLFQVSFYKPEILNQVAALEIKKWKQLYFKVRSAFFYAFSFIKLYLPSTYILLSEMSKPAHPNINILHRPPQ